MSSHPTQPSPWPKRKAPKCSAPTQPLLYVLPGYTVLVVCPDQILLANLNAVLARWMSLACRALLADVNIWRAGKEVLGCWRLKTSLSLTFFYSSGLTTKVMGKEKEVLVQPLWLIQNSTSWRLRVSLRTTFLPSPFILENYCKVSLESLLHSILNLS